MASIGSEQLVISEVARLLGVSRPRVWQLRKQPGFPAPSGTDGGKEWWYEGTILRWAASAGRGLAERAPLFYRPVTAGAPARFDGGQVIEGHVVLSFSCELGDIAVAYPPVTNRQGDLPRLLTGMPWADCLVVVTPFIHALGVEMTAVDRQDPDREYTPQPEDILRVLGQPLPYWAPELRRPSEMLRWRPGADVTHIRAIPDADTTVWLELADDLTDASPARAALLHLAHTVQDRATDTAVHDIEMIEANGGPAVTIAARPLLSERPNAGDDEAPDPMLLRAGWTQILERDDRLAAACVREAWQWDGGRAFPFNGIAAIDLTPDSTAQTNPAAEWAATLQPSKPTAAHAIFDQYPDGDLLIDPHTGIPAVRNGVIRTAYPQFLPSHAPLAEVIFHHHEIWVRTSDGKLWLAPRLSGNGLAYGYTGGSTYSLATALDLLLDDICAPAAERPSSDIPPGLLEIAQTKWLDGMAVTRDQLLTARKSR